MIYICIRFCALLTLEFNIVGWLADCNLGEWAPSVWTTQAFTRRQTQNILACNVFLFAWFGIVWGFFFSFGPANDSVCAWKLVIVRDGEFCGKKNGGVHLWTLKDRKRTSAMPHKWHQVEINEYTVTWERFRWCTLGFSSANTKCSKLRAHRHIFDVHKWLLHGHLRGVITPITRPKLS
jgi:hypothetical protein